ncbi:unnamed protein product [Mytilus coruscus]|uniref:Uncharacterized protein n=1 Tax=Mytilus coruscus TaxID=42192 RepID=A0A6J8EB65_MYTCO|nr:unnamed protein product [Mytilus coruscus]
MAWLGEKNEEDKSKIMAQARKDAEILKEKSIAEEIKIEQERRETLKQRIEPDQSPSIPGPSTAISINSPSPSSSVLKHNQSASASEPTQHDLISKPPCWFNQKYITHTWDEGSKLTTYHGKIVHYAARRKTFRIDNTDTADTDSDVTVWEISDESVSDMIGPSPAQKVSSSPFVPSQVLAKRRRLTAVDLAPKAKFRDVLQSYMNTAVDCVREANLLREENTRLKQTPKVIKHKRMNKWKKRAITAERSLLREQKSSKAVTSNVEKKLKKFRSLI